MDPMLVVNLMFCVGLVSLGATKYKVGRSKAILFALGFLMFGISHFSLLMGWGAWKVTLIIIRSLGYLFVIASVFA